MVKLFFRHKIFFLRIFQSRDGPVRPRSNLEQRIGYSGAVIWVGYKSHNGAFMGYWILAICVFPSQVSMCRKTSATMQGRRTILRKAVSKYHPSSRFERPTMHWRHRRSSLKFTGRANGQQSKTLNFEYTCLSCSTILQVQDLVWMNVGSTHGNSV